MQTVMKRTYDCQNQTQVLSYCGIDYAFPGSSERRLSICLTAIHPYAGRHQEGAWLSEPGAELRATPG